MRKIVVTGANGFLGSAILSHIVKESVFIPIAVSRKGVTDNTLDGIQCYQIGDLSNEINWQPILLNTDVVVHTAARVHIIKDTSVNPLDDFRKVNVVGTLKLAHEAAAAGVQRFIFISSISVNGAETFLDKFDEHSPAQPYTPYAVSKKEAEDGLRALAEITDMEIVIIRPPLVYGGAAPGNFRSLLKIIRFGVPLPLAKVVNKKSFIFIDNLVNFVMTCLMHPNAGNETFIISDGFDLSVPQMILYLYRGLHQAPIFLPVPLSVLKFVARAMGRGAAYRQLCGSLQLDISKARTMLEWNPPVPVVDALQKTAEDFLTLKKNGF